MRDPWYRIGAGYFVTTALLIAVVILRLFFDESLEQNASVLMFVVAVAAGAAIGGWWPGVFATALGVLCNLFVFRSAVPSASTIWPLDRNEGMYLVFFAAVGLMISWLYESLHRARASVAEDVEKQKRLVESTEVWRARYEAAVQSSTSILYDSNRVTGEVVYGGDCESILGFSASELNGNISKWIERIHPDDRHLFNNEVNRTDADRSAYRADYRMIRKDGQVIWMREDGHFAVKTGVHPPEHIIGLVRDVTQQRRTEEALRESEEQFRLLTDAMPQVVWVADVNGLVRHYNSRVHSFAGVRRANDGTWVWEPVMHADDLAMTVDAWREAVAKREPYQCEHRIHMADGSCRWHLSRGLPVTNASSGELLWFGSATDIHDLKTSQQALRDSEQYLETIIETAPSPIVVTSAEGRIVLFNRACESVTGYQRDEVADQSMVQLLVPPACHDQVTSYLTELEELDVQEPHEYPWITKDGEQRLIEWRCTKLPHGRRLAIGVDVTDRKRLEDELRHQAAQLSEADRRKDEFLAVLAHELRNPLAPIRMGLELMKLAKDEPETLENTRAMMERQTQQLISLVDDLLDMSRITRGKLELRRSHVELAQIVRNATETSHPSIGEGSHELRIDLPEHPIYLDVDPQRIAQVVSNLLNNSARYTPSGGTICLSARLVDKVVELSVKDNGAGIPQEMQARIFEMFSQLDRPMERAFSGLGIGLTLVKSLVEMHAGSVEVRSEGLNQGSEFIVRLPVASVEPVSESRAPVNQVAEKLERRVLVVDDNRAAADTLGTVVRLLGNDVRTASDGREAVQVAAEFLPDVVLMDIGMPDMNGYEAARFIRGQQWGESMMLVAVSGWGQEADKQRTREAGFDHHLVKPAEPKEVERLLQLSAKGE